MSNIDDHTHLQGAVSAQFNEMLGEVRDLQAELALARSGEAAVREYARVQGEFLAQISNETHRAMSTMVGLSEILLTVDLSTEQQRAGQQLHNAVQELQTLFLEILNYTQTEGGMPTVKPTDIDRRTTCHHRFDGCKVLVVEDNAVNRLVVTQMLGHLGCLVDIVENGAEAVLFVKEHVYDIIFMDCDMPIMSGFEATKLIRELDGLAAETPIVALTGSALPNSRERCLQAGMNDYLAKPIDMDALQGALEQWVGRTTEVERPKPTQDIPTDDGFSETESS
jgi:CheY-like chemotaxis protein